MNHEKIIYLAILRKKHTILTEYTDCSGNFSQIIKEIMDEVINIIEDEPEEYKAKFNYGKYTFYLMKLSNLYMMVMIKKSEHLPNKEEDILFYRLLYSIHEEIIKKVKIENTKKLKAYSLGLYSPDLKTKLTAFNKDKIFFNENLKDEEKIEKFDVLNGKKFDETKQFPILSNEQVHRDNLIYQRIAGLNTSLNSTGTMDSFNEDILQSSLTHPLKDEDIPPISDNNLREDEIIVNNNQKKESNICCLNLIIIILVIILMLLIIYSIFIFKSEI